MMENKRIRRYLRKRIPKIYTALENFYHRIMKRGKFAPNAGNENVYNSRSSITNRVFDNPMQKQRILLIGRIREGDSIANHTQSFLHTIDYDSFDYFLYDEYSHALFFCKSSESREYVKTCFAKEIDPGFFDMLIYLNVLSNGTEEYPFEDRVPPKGAFLSFVYPVFDGTIPPFEWIEIINDYFDAVLVPCNNLKKIFENADLLKPVFELPEALDLNNYAENKDNDERCTFTFGWSGTFEDRKNPIKIMEAFSRAFGENADVRLHMHARYIDRSTTAGKSFDSIRDNLPNNIVLTEGVLGEMDYIALMKSFDAYIYVSMGEGYSITPRQAMASGCPIILSAIPTHRDITKLDESDGVFWVSALDEVEAFQPSLNNQSCGVMYDIKENDLVKAMVELYERREEIEEKSHMEKRKNAALMYDVSSCMMRYRTIFLPKELILGKENIVGDDGIVTRDYDLYIKYKYYLQNTSRRIVICPAHDGGFCSVFNKWISHLAYAPSNTIVLPDWRIRTLLADVQKRTGKSQFVSFCYGNEKDRNIFFRLFTNPYEGIIGEEIIESDLMYEVADSVLDSLDFNGTNEPNLTYINAYNLYDNEDYFLTFRQKYNRIYKKYIHLQPELNEKIQKYYIENMTNKFVVSAQIKSASQSSELREDDRPGVEKYEEHLLRILQSENIEIESDKWRFYIASDNTMSIQYFVERYSNHILFQKMDRLTKQNDDEYQEAKKKFGIDMEGFGLQHRAAKNPEKWTLQNAYEILFDVNMLAKGEYFIFVMSNISTMVSYLNPELKMIYCR